MGKIQFNLNQCETKRANSLSNNDVVYVFESRKGDIYVVTHSSGLNLVSSKDLLCDHIEFIHLNKLNGLPSDLAYAILEGKVMSCGLILRIISVNIIRLRIL